MGGVERLGPTALGMVGVFHGSGFRTCGLHVELRDCWLRVCRLGVQHLERFGSIRHLQGGV